MSDSPVKLYRTSAEQNYNLMLCLFGGAIWLGLVYFLFTADAPTLMALLPMSFYVILFIAFMFISALLFRAAAMGNMILISEEQFPHIHEMVQEGAKKLGISAPEAFIFNSNGLFNAFARQVFGRKYLLLTSAIVDATTDEQIRFIIGHELGHHAAGHLSLTGFLLRLPARIIPFLHKAYSRQCEFTCDKLGYFVAKDVESSCKAISMLGCGCQKLNTSLNLFAFEKQEQMVPATSGFITEIFRTHPRLTRRVISIKNTRLLS